MNLKLKVRSIQDFPIEGIDFKDITTVFKDKDAFKELILQMKEKIEQNNIDIDVVVGVEARGFMVGAPLAYELGVGFVPVRKPGKLPGEILSHEYELEYGVDMLEIHKDSIEKGQKILIVDDLLATGGTALATAKMIEKLGGHVELIMFFIELEYIKGREQIEDYNVISLLKY